MESIDRALNHIEKTYSDKTTSRSSVPLMNHIYEGVEILKDIGAQRNTIAAYCLHPIIQNDEDFALNYKNILSYPSDVVMFLMEYRAVANKHLHAANIIYPEQINLSPIKEVNQMLYADKKQNQKDFLSHHNGSHRHSDTLRLYFECWIEALENKLEINND